MYTLYSIPGTCSTGITILLKKLAVDFKTVAREDVPNYTEIVPTNAVPALKTEDGQIITEGAAIVLYLLEKHNNDMLPADLSEKAEFLKWLMFDYATLHVSYSKLFTIAMKVKMDEAEQADVMQQLGDQTSALWEIVDKRLSGKTFIMGDQATVVDYLMAIYSSWGNYFPNVKISLGQNVERFIADVQALPEFKAGFQTEQIQFKAAA
ncbi:MAG: glutathione S-transferase family protein [Alphaproteobacteria bacterium]